jgi:hypothetical protein
MSRQYGGTDQNNVVQYDAATFFFLADIMPPADATILTKTPS